MFVGFEGQYQKRDALLSAGWKENFFVLCFVPSN
jgi:hypothetical protein